VLCLREHRQMAPQGVPAYRDHLEARVGPPDVLEHRLGLRPARHHLPRDASSLHVEGELDRHAKRTVEVDDGRVAVGDPIEAPFADLGQAFDLDDVGERGDLARPPARRVAPDPIVGDRKILARVRAVQDLDRHLGVSRGEGSQSDRRRDANPQGRDEEPLSGGLLLLRPQLSQTLGRAVRGLAHGSAGRGPRVHRAAAVGGFAPAVANHLADPHRPAIETGNINGGVQRGLLRTSPRGDALRRACRIAPEHGDWGIPVPRTRSGPRIRSVHTIGPRRRSHNGS